MLEKESGTLRFDLMSGKKTTRWLVENPPERGGYEETALQDPFDYAAEDRLADWWRAAIASASRRRSSGAAA